MHSIYLPAINCETSCPICGKNVEFPLFMASHYDFVTYQGCKTGTYYRLNEELIKYGVTSKEEALAPAVSEEGGSENLIQLPSLIYCQSCNKSVPGGQVTQLNETSVKAVCLPINN